MLFRIGLGGECSKKPVTELCLIILNLKEHLHRFIVSLLAISCMLAIVFLLYYNELYLTDWKTWYFAMNRERNLVKNVLIISVGTVLPKLSNIIILPILTAELTKAEYGTYDLIGTLVSLFLPVATLQIQSAVFRFLIDERENGTETKRIVTNAVFFGVMLSSVSVLILLCALQQLKTDVRIMICLFFYLEALLNIGRQLVRGLSNNKLYSLSASIQAITNTVLVILTVSIWKQGLKGTLFAMIAASFTGLFVLLVKGNIISHISCSFISGTMFEKMFRYSWPMIPNQLSSWILNASDRMVLTAFMGLEATAIYGAAYKIPSMLSVIQNIFTYAWQENASLASKDSDREKYYSDMFDKMFCLMSGMLGLLIATTPIIFRILIRGDYEDSYAQIPILFLGMLFASMSVYIGGIYVAFKKTLNVGVTTALAAGLNLIIDLALVNKIGIYAASVSTLISYLVWLAYRMVDVQKFQRIYYNSKKMFLQLIILVLMCVLCWRNELKTNIANIMIACIFSYVFNRTLICSAINIIHKKIKISER